VNGLDQFLVRGDEHVQRVVQGTDRGNIVVIMVVRVELGRRGTQLASRGSFGTSRS
jgi:hypothetical protein